MKRNAIREKRAKERWMKVRGDYLPPHAPSQQEVQVLRTLLFHTMCGIAEDLSNITCAIVFRRREVCFLHTALNLNDEDEDEDEDMKEGRHNRSIGRKS